jgi:RNA recognition motif-containing protein
MYTHDDNINEIINEFMNIYIKIHKKFSDYEDYEERRKKITIKREISEYVRINTNNKKSVTKINNFKKKINDFYVYYNIKTLNYSGKAEFIYRMLHNNDFTTIYDIKHNDILLNTSNNSITNNNTINNNYETSELMQINDILLNTSNNSITNNNTINNNYETSELMQINNGYNEHSQHIYFINGLYYKEINEQLLYDYINNIYYKMLVNI